MSDAMRILFVNRLIAGTGGDQTYIMNLAQLLESYGHQVAYFSVNDSRNIPTPWSKYFMSPISFDKMQEKKSLKNIIKVLSRIVYSVEARKKIGDLINNFKPNIAHLHSVHNFISMSIIHELKKADIPIVWTLHNYEAICPNGSFFYKNRICDACMPFKFYMAPIKRCKKNSFLASIAAATANYSPFLLQLYKLVDQYQAPSMFLRSKYIKAGFEIDKIIHLPHFVYHDNCKPSFRGDGYGVFVGRLIRSKGVHTLIRALAAIPSIPFKIIGEGPERTFLEDLATDLNLKKLEFVGFMSHDKVQKFIANAKFVVVPSEWYENFSASIYEAFCLGKPVIGSSIGGIPEMIDHGINGFLFQAGNVKELATQLHSIMIDSKRTVEMGRMARKKYERLWNKELHYTKLIKAYYAVVSK